MRTNHLHFVVFSVACTSVIFSEELLDKVHSTASYDPEALLSKIFNLNGTIESRATNGLKFEDGNNDFVIFDSNMEFLQPPTNVHFNPIVDNAQKLPFGNDKGKVEKKRRRRKPRVQGLGQGFAPGYYGPYAPYVPPPGIGPSTFYGQGSQSIYGPSKPQRPSLASAALSSVSEALTSIALFDDRQCVARLLCEAASGAPGSGTLQSIAGLQPLLRLLSAYQGVSSNPLFVFGRAAFLGMSSKSNPASCRYAYPLCPTDPEQLVYYLNNHNGGFFRFFNSPQRGQQNVNQFYNQLSQNHEIQQNRFPQSNGYINSEDYQSNRLDDFEIQKYGTKYPYDQNKYGHLNKIRFKNNDHLEDRIKIGKRIQNRPSKYLDDLEDNFSFENAHDFSTKWSFPEENNIKPNKIRVGKGLKFPESSYVDYNDKEGQNKRDPRGFIFPDTRSVEYLNFNKYQDSDFKDNNYNYNFNNFNADIHKGHSSDHNENDKSVQTIYVVRGNGDPNHPEIIKLRPGQTVY